MSAYAEIVRRLGAAGCTIEQIAVAVEIAEQDNLARSRRQSEANAARQRRYRSKPSRDETLHDVTQRDETLHDVTRRNEPLPPPVHINSPPKKNSEPKKVLRSMPSDWILSEDHFAFATARGWSRQKAEAEGERFRDYALSSGKRYRDIDAAWRNWVTSPYQNTAVNGKPNGQSKRSGSLLDALDQLEIGNGDAGGAVDLLRLPPR